MIEWDRSISGAVQLAIMILFVVLLLFKRRKLGKGINYFILAGGIVTGLDLIIYIIRLSAPKFNSIPFYSIGVNFGVFSLFFLYLRNVLELEKSKKINLILIILFLLGYLLFAIFSDYFFTTFSFEFYFFEVFILLANIYLVLHETFNSDKVLNIWSYYPVWACIGLMSIYLGVTPLLIISNTAMKMMSINIFFIILFIVNVIGYSILITGIFFAKNINTKK